MPSRTSSGQPDTSDAAPAESGAAPGELPTRPDLKYLKKQAKDLLKAHQAADRSACAPLRLVPRFDTASDQEILAADLTLHDAQSALAREYGYPHWAALRDAVASMGAQRQPPNSTSVTPTLKMLNARTQRHIETLGFATVGAYRIWCHKQGFDTQLEKTDGQLYDELLHHQQTPATPTRRKDYRPAEARKITQAFEGVEDGLWDGWKEPFKHVSDDGERDALHRLLLHCSKYAPLCGPLVWPVAKHYKDWTRRIEEWIPKAKSKKALYSELVRFLLGCDELPANELPIGDKPGSGEAPTHCHARISARRETILSREEVEQFEELGYLKLPGAFPRETAQQIHDFMWSELERLHGFHKSDPTTWQKEGWNRDHPPTSWTKLRLNRSKDHEVYDGLASPRMKAAIEELAGGHASSLSQSWGAFTPCFPSLDRTTAWDLGHRWGCYGDPSRTWMMGVRTFFTDVVPQGGGLPVVEGSHRLVRTYFDSLPSSERLVAGQAHIDHFYQQHAYFRELVGHEAQVADRVPYFMKQTTNVEGVPLRVVELTGEPGDAVFYNRSLICGRGRNMTDEPVFTRG